MKPYYQDEWVTIYHGDCREILPELPKVDLVLTDPPFNVGKDYGTESNDLLSLPEYYDFISATFQMVYFTMSDNSSLLIKIPTKYLPTITQALYEFQYKWTIGLYTPNSMKPMSKGFNQLGLVLWYYKQFPLKVKFANDVYTNNRNSQLRRNGNLHTNPMDDNFVLRLISDYSNNDSIILDPFLGSGTTAYCAKKLNRKCIGIEIEERYCEVAARRCSQGVFKLE